MTTRRRTIGLASILAFGCTLTDKNLGQIGGTTGEGDDLSSTSDDGATGQGDATMGSSTGEGDDDPIGCVPASVDVPECHEDLDDDFIRTGCDNAPDHFNPTQFDMDEDGFGDIIDLCPTVASDSNTADSDKDGVGNDCDSCGQTLAQYNDHDSAISVADYMFVRNIPWQGDADQDGVGDVCSDNCVATANCSDEGACQRDDNADLVGDACAGVTLLGAAGPVGIGPEDDFDQDGLENESDACPRQPVPEIIPCMVSDECPDGSVCEGAVCDHVDSDNDAVGDICDTCPSIANPMQTMDGAAQEEDEDGDFVAEVCETSSTCSTSNDPRPMDFYEVSANGACCTVALVVDDDGALLDASKQTPILDPDGLPITLDCSFADEDARTCRRLPAFIATSPGILVPPPGCDEALAAAGTDVSQNRRLDISDFDGSYDALWATRCALPQWDQDFDGLGDACDMCPFMFDPDNQAFIDDEGTAWPEFGKYCNGDYDPDAICDAMQD